MNIKKLIAREGLIIFGCITLAAFLFFLNILIPEPELPHHYLITTGGHEYKVHTQYYMDTNHSDLSAPAWSSDELEIFRSIKKDKPADFKDSNLDVIPLDLKFEYQGKNDIKNIISTIGILSLFTYPIYLLIRFIIWAIRTLKQRE